MKKYISSKDENYYTNMLKVINSIGGNSLRYNWLISDIETNDDIYFKEEYVILSTDDLLKLLNENTNLQWIWGCFSAIPEYYSKEDILKYEIPFINNRLIYDNIGIIQHPLAEIEIDAVDSTFVQLISKDDKIAELFKKSFPLAEVE